MTTGGVVGAAGGVVGAVSTGDRDRAGCRRLACGVGAMTAV
jgi:hypothetical protein